MGYLEVAGSIPSEGVSGIGQAKPEDQVSGSVRSSVPQRIDQPAGGVAMPSSAPVRIDGDEKGKGVIVFSMIDVV